MKDNKDNEIHIIELKNASPQSMAQHVTRFFVDAEVSQDADTNSLIIRCDRKTLADIKKLIEKLDKPAKPRGRDQIPTVPPSATA